MINLFADMGIQPSTLQAGLLHATQSTDHDAPITAFTASTVAVVGHKSVVFGHSVDPGGGVVAGNEISIGDGNWHYAVGHGNWSFTWIPTEAGPVQVQARAIDDSLNLGDAAEITVQVYDTLIRGTHLKDVVLSEGISFAPSNAGKGNVKVRHSTSDDDAIFGKGGNDIIFGGAGDDRISGALGNDKIVGGVGQDILIGAHGRDTFRFDATNESTAAAPDLIVDFHSGRDKIDLRGMALADGQFIGETHFSGTAGELRFDSTQHLFEGDFDGDGVADFAVKLATGRVDMHDLLF